MIQITSGNEFHLNTDDTSYILKVLDSGHIGNLYYGKRIRARETYANLYRGLSLGLGSSTDYSRETAHFSLDTARLEFPSYGKGDYREPAIEILLPDGSRTCDFKYKSHSVFEGEPQLEGLPHAFCNNDDVETLELVLDDSFAGVELTLSYTVYADRNVMTRSVRLSNTGKDDIVINRLMSFNLGF